MRLLAPLLLSVYLAAAAAQAGSKHELAAEADINAGLFVVAVADKIRRECGRISARFFRARSYMIQLKEMAADRGYSEEEIDTYLDDRAEKQKMRARRNAYFERHGVSNLDPESLCRLGRAEIEKKSQIGWLLKAK